MDIIIRLWDMLTSSVGTFALVGVCIGLFVGQMRKLIDRPVVLTIVGIVIAVWMTRYIPRPSQVQAQAQPQPVAVRQASHTRDLHKARPAHRRRYVQYQGF
jgi:hypothetical protein